MENQPIPDQTPDNQPGFTQELVNRIAWEAIAEQRRARRWGIFFKLLFVFYIIAITFMYYPFGMTENPIVGKKHTALVEIDGVIAADTEANADSIAGGLRAAFDNKNTAGVILRINSPGGSPVQAGYINDEIRRLRTLHPEIPLYAVVTDICASGGYYIAVAADKIYANKASIVGSIGVIMEGFGFVETIKKLGVERRMMHAGENKGFLDPFSPLRPEEVAHTEKLLQQVYHQFIDTVKAGRGNRLKQDDKLFSGLVWTGEESVELGLVDGLGSASYVAREVIGAEEIVDYTLHETYFDRFARKMGATVAGVLSDKYQLR
jgi:protease-4